MRRFLLLVSLSLCGVGCGSAESEPADLLIADARIVTGSDMMDRGSIVIRDGRIHAVVENGEGERAKRVVDAEGMTALPGLIDVHRHFLPYSGATRVEELERYIEDEVPSLLEGLLRAGLTTVMSPGDFAPEIFEVRMRIGRGDPGRLRYGQPRSPGPHGVHGGGRGAGDRSVCA